MTDATRHSQLTIDELPQRKIQRAPRLVAPEPPRRSSFHELEAQDAAEESRFAVLGWRLMGGVNIPDGYLRLAHANRMDTADDPSMFDTDFELKVDGQLAGYLDIEVKHRWNAAAWPWPWINVAKHPMAHWKRGQFSGRLTNKLVDFHKMPRTSFWVGVRLDFNAAMVVRASDLFDLGEEQTVQTSYYHDGQPLPPLPIIRLPKDVGTEVNDPDTFAAFIAGCFGDA